MDISNNQIKFLDMTAKLNINYSDLKKTIQNSEVSSKENEVYFKLTPAALMEYEEGKEQYVIVDTNNRVYAKPEDIENYVSSTNLMEFLGKYGIVDYEQLQKLYDELYSQKSGNEGIALRLEDLQKNVPSVDNSVYWAEEPTETVGQKIYANMLERVSGTLNNLSRTYCSCCFKVIADMLSYTDVASVTNEEIYNAFKEYSGIEYGSVDYMKQQLNDLYEAKKQVSASTQTYTPTVEPEKQEDTIVDDNSVEDNSGNIVAEEDNSSSQSVDVVQSVSIADNLEDSVTIENVTEVQTEQIQDSNVNAVDISISQSSKNINIEETTSTGDKVVIPIQKVSTKFVGLNIKNNSNISYTYINDRDMRVMKNAVNRQIDMTGRELMAAQRIERLNNDEPLSVDSTDLSNLSLKAKRLFSNYKIDDNGEYTLDSKSQRQLKALRQKITDVYYIAQNYKELGVNQGIIEDNKGDKQNKETDTTVRGAIKSVQKDIQRALGVENFDFDKYLNDYSDWADKYAEVREKYDSKYLELQKLQVPQDSDKATWYTNVWSSFGGVSDKLGENVITNIVTNNADHGHHHGSYSNELSISFDIPDISNLKQDDNFIELSNEQLNSDVWLKSQMQNKTVSIEKYINKDLVQERLSDTKDIHDSVNTVIHPKYNDVEGNKIDNDEIDFNFAYDLNNKTKKDDTDGLKDIFKF